MDISLPLLFAAALLSAPAFFLARAVLKSHRASGDASRRQDWHGELHFGALAMLQGMGLGLALALISVCLFFALR